ncbi:MAB_1171c family putative transporter [Streptomyces sp. NPDC089799]|uniref:MAB_1171c family putative transporter n=1 Tax=Streptomyces sp. NPDC089799 TaxID=3155066 RepID=UPI0034194B1C
MKGLDFYIPAVVLVVAFTCRLPELIRHWRDPLVRAVSVLLLVASSVFLFAAPPTIGALNDLTGIPNFSAPLVYCILTAFSASCLLLLINWRGGPDERTRQLGRWCAGTYSTVIVALIALFALGDAPVERLRDFDTYYATTPFVREMILVYLLAHTVAAVVMTVLCRRWSLHVTGSLRSGLLLMVSGFILNLIFDAAKFTAVIARWTGNDLDFFSTSIAPPVASFSALLIGIGFVLPLLVQRLSVTWQTWVTYHRLGPLWRELRTVVPVGSRSVRISLWSPADLRVTQRVADIHDGFLHLDPYFDHVLRDRTRAAVLAAGADGRLAEATAEAAMVAAAVRARAADPEERIIGLADAYTSASSEGPRDLVGISLALRSPLVEDTRRRAASTESSTP